MPRALKIFLYTLAAVFSALAILFSVAAWRLSSEPLSLAFLRPYFEETLAERYPRYGVDFEDIILTWAGWARTLDVRVVEVCVVNASGELLASLPEVSLGLSWSALLQGKVRPTTIEMLHPTIRLVRGADGTLMFQMGPEEPGRSEAPGLLFEEAPGLLSEIVGGEAAGEVPERQRFRQLSVLGADFFIEDQLNEVTWHAAGVDINLYRAKAGITGDLALDVILQDMVIHVEGDIHYDRPSEELSLGIRFVDAEPARIAAITPHMSALSSLKMPVSGRFGILFDSSFQISAVDFDLSGGPGALSLPDHFRSDLEVTLFHAEGRISEAFTNLVLDDLFLDFGGPSLSSNGLFTGTSEAFSLDAEVNLTDLPLDDIASIWPKGLGENALEWITANLSDGYLRRLTARLVLESGDLAGDFLPAEAIEGEIELENVTINYLDGLPEIRGANAAGGFDAERLELALGSGSILERLEIREGHILLTGIDRGEEAISLDVALQGPAEIVFEILDRPRLGYPGRYAIDPASVGGTSVTQLHFGFPLLNELSLEDIVIHAAVTFRDFSLPGVLEGYDISDAQLGATLDNDGMDVQGPIVLNGVPLSLAWRENFRDGEPFTSRIALTGRLGNRGLEALGASAEPYIIGPVGLEATYTDLDRHRQTADLRLDVLEATLALPELLWSKPPGVPGVVQISLEMENEGPIRVPGFVVATPDFIAEGQALFEPGFDGLKRADITRLVFGLNDLEATLVPLSEGGYEIALRGESLDLQPFIDRLLEEEEEEEEEQEETASFVLTLDVARLITREDQEITEAKARIEQRGGSWRRASLDGRLPGGELLQFRLEPIENNRRLLTMTSNDAGSVARVFDLYDNGIGGRVDFKAEIDDNRPDRPMTGLIEITDYRITEAPALAQILSYGTFFGLLDLLQGEGISFSTLELPFTFVEDKLIIGDAHTSGTSIGINVSGVADFGADRADLKGTIVPAYIINSLLGNIPIVGDILVGGEGEGIIATSFKVTGSLDDPDISVNPASMLTPGFLRHLFDIFETGDEEEEGEEARREAEAEAGPESP